MRKVVFVIAAGEVGGAERSSLAWMEKLPAAGWEPSVFVQREGGLSRRLGELGRAYVAGSGRRLRSPGAYASDLCRLLALVRQTGAALLLSSGCKAHLYGGAAAALAGRPALCFLHDFPERSALDRLAAKLPGAVVANSQATAAAAEALFRRRPEVVHPAVEVARFAFDSQARARFRADWGLSDEQPVAGYLGRLQSWKGVHIFLEGLARARRQDARLVGLVVGSAMDQLDRGYEPSLHGLAGDLDLLPDGIRFLPFQPDPTAVLSAIDCLVHVPILPEPFGMAVVEAMAAGRWLIASAAGGILETLRPEVGELVPPGDAEAVAAALLRFLAQPERARQAATAGPRLAQAFDASVSTRQLARLMAEVAA